MLKNVKGKEEQLKKMATLRAANMELVELFGRQWIGGVVRKHIFLLNIYKWIMQILQVCMEV